jgi:hypothetical protein
MVLLWKQVPALLSLDTSEKNQIRKLRLYLPKLTFLFSYRFNVCIHGASEI